MKNWSLVNNQNEKLFVYSKSKNLKKQELSIRKERHEKMGKTARVKIVNNNLT